MDMGVVAIMFIVFIPLSYFLGWAGAAADFRRFTKQNDLILIKRPKE